MASDVVGVRGQVLLTWRDLDTGAIERRTVTNLVVTTGLTHIASVVAGTATGAWYIELGTGTTAPTSGDTALGTPSAGSWRSVTAQTASSSSATFGAVYPAASSNGTWTEVGLFGGATATAGSGSLVARIVTTVTKTSSQVLTVSWSLTFTT